MRERPTNSDNVIDSRDVIEAIEELETQFDDWVEGHPEVEGDLDAAFAAAEPEAAAELQALQALAEEAAHYSPDWRYGATLIRDSYFVEYAKELADDIGAIDKNAHWPLSYIDWDAAAEALKADYTPVDFDGVTYWVR